MGFEATDTNSVCHCLPILEYHGVNCRSNQTILRSPPAWIGYHFQNKSTVVGAIEGIIYHSKCPEDYCVPKSVEIYTSIKKFDGDVQCDYNRSGLLCGTFKHNLTSIVGSSSCEESVAVISPVLLTNVNLPFATNITIVFIYQQ